MGSQDSETSAALLDATERVLRKDGYAAVSSRRVAEEAGIKQPLVYYYFRTVDELVIATFKRRTTRRIELLKAALASNQPLRGLWKLNIDETDARVTAEFLALGNHNKAIRAIARQHLQETRRIEVEALSRLLKHHGVELDVVTPAALSFLVTAISQWLTRESALGVSDGHSDVEALMDWALSRLS
jgi:AcrR family transcriptional regulator